MTDKEKRELRDGVISIFKRFNILDNTATIGGLRDDILRYIDSLQEEHKLKPKFQEGNKIVYVGERKELDTDEHTILYVYDDMYVTTWGKKIPFKFQDDYQLVEEPVSIWHDASEKPERDDLLIETNDGRIIHRQSINNYGMVKRWAYTSVLLNLDNSCNLKNNSQEEPVSEDLGKYINELSKQFPEVSFAKLSRIAVRVAKWQKEQFEKDYTDLCNGIATAKGIAVAMAYDKGVADTKEQIKEALLLEVLSCFMHGGEADEVVAKLDEVLNQKK